MGCFGRLGRAVNKLVDRHIKRKRNLVEPVVIVDALAGEVPEAGQKSDAGEDRKASRANRKTRRNAAENKGQPSTSILAPAKTKPRRVEKRVRFLVEEDQLEDSLAKFLRTRENKDMKPKRPLYRPPKNEAWPLQQPNPSRPLYRPDYEIAVNSRPAGPQTGTSNKAEVHVNNNAEMDIDDAIEDIIRNMGEDA